MRFIILKSEVVDEALVILGLTELSQKASGVTPRWINFKEAKTNCVNPEKCDLLSFEDESVAIDIVESIAEENIAYIGVDA
ncbi:hypothetical protein [Kamptonema sp. UHCC 0994]|uniref:hypothetical protein n=1 Tax=Kamptonema sp. UHCC 0994 TaxID=3031329 RepID=UPI0023B9BA16|nr:hypothetical protein [Kamptonema sp. UHCC 0994]MDF0553871.1 hypothetical protein [Kamptonema sp. UHCC 0994]